ncbi:MAG: CvpA family protein [Bacilli bacterium]|nr:CvpA family protein [Bacilli bacterium]
MNIFDIVIILILLMFLIVGWKRGVIKEAVSLVGIVLVFVLSLQFKGVLGNFFCKYLPFIPFKGRMEDITSLNLLFYQVLAFLLIFCILIAAYEILMKVSKWVQKIVNLTIILIIPSKILGALLSFIKGYIILFAVFVILMAPLGNSKILKESTLMNGILYNTPVLSTKTKDLTESIKEIYKLGEKIAKDKITKEEANKKTIEILIKYDIVKEELVEDLIKNKKLILNKKG